MQYHFKALLRNGTIIDQSRQNDQSATTEGRNAFYDVLQNIEEVRAFSLFSDDGADEYLIDLETLLFEVNGKQFKMTDEELTNIRLIYFVRKAVVRDLVQNTTVQGIVSYHFGFQGLNGAGENVQRVMVIKS